MSEVNLPEGWAATKISEIADVNPKKIEAAAETMAGFVPMSHAPTNFNGSLSYEEKPWGEIKKSYTNFKDHDVIVAKVTPCFENGKAAIVRVLPNGIGAGSSEFYVIRPATKKISTRLLFSIVKSHKFLNEGAANMTGAVGLRRVPRAFVESFPISLPPLAEQKVIADKLDTLLAQVETTKAGLDHIPEILKTFRQSVLAAAVSGKLSEEWRELNKGFEEWKQVELKEAANIIDPHPSHRTPKVNDGGVPYIGIGDLRDDGSIDFENSRKVSVDVLKEHNERYTLKVGDFVFGKIGTLGKATVLPIGIDYTLSANVILIQPIENSTIPRYLQFFLSSPTTMDDIARQANSTSQAAFGIKKMRAFQCKLPRKEEQTEIVRRVEELFAFADSIEQKANAALARVNNLTQSILAKAFRGELTADWRAANPDLISGENSAEVLLEKIKAERETLKKQPKPKRTTVKKKTGSRMSKQIIKVVDALKEAGKPLSGQQLLAAAGYPSDSSTDQLEQFFLDIRGALATEKSIIKLERGDDGQDWFALAETVETNKA